MKVKNAVSLLLYIPDSVQNRYDSLRLGQKTEWHHEIGEYPLFRLTEVAEVYSIRYQFTGDDKTCDWRRMKLVFGSDMFWSDTEHALEHLLRQLPMSDMHFDRHRRFGDDEMVMVRAMRIRDVLKTFHPTCFCGFANCKLHDLPDLVLDV